MARALAGDDAAVGALGTHHEGAALDGAALDAARRVLAEHPGGDGVVVVAGRTSYAESGEVTAEALRALAAALPKAKFLPALRRGNVFGALDMGLAPGVLPGRVGLDAGRARFTTAWGSVPDKTGRSTAEILASMAAESSSEPGARWCVPVTAPSCWAPTRSVTSPTHVPAKQALSEAATSSWWSPRSPSQSAGRADVAPLQAHGAPGDDDQSSRTSSSNSKAWAPDSPGRSTPPRWSARPWCRPRCSSSTDLTEEIVSTAPPTPG